eukprot:gene11692-15655_t
MNGGGGESSSGLPKMNISRPNLPMFGEEPACAKYCPNITFKQRVMGFAGCAVMGWILSLMGTFTLIGGHDAGHLATFVILYVIGNVVALFATGFLLGPRSQCRQMFHPTRKYSTIFYLVMLIIVFSVAVAKVNIGIVIFLLFIEILAALWYSISYIPFGRKLVIAFFKRTICKPCADAGMFDKGAAGGAGGGGKNGFAFLADDA